jgi:uncharacterized membrane protein YhaH (DUF805 family)
MNWYLQALKKYADFSGRARRREYWFYMLFYVIILVVLSICDGFVGTTMQSGVGILTLIYILAVLIPTIAVSVRRLHDTGRSGWWILIELVPIVGFFIFLYFMVSDSNPGTNAYGPSPKAGEMPVAPATT